MSSRQTFENRSRAQNQREVTSTRRGFKGMYSDMPGNELDPNQCLDITNALAYNETMVPRDGQLQPSITLPSGYETASFTASRSANSVTISGASTSTAHLGKLIVYSNGSRPDIISARVNSSIYTVSYDDQTAAGTFSSSAIIRERIYGWAYHKKLQIYILHIGNDLWKLSGTTWTQICKAGNGPAQGSTGLPKAWSKIEEYGDSALIWNGGLFRVNFTTNTYWKTNVESSTNTLMNQDPYGASYATGYLRRYGWTMTRQDATGNNPLYWDRADNVIAQESAFNALDSTNIDYREVFTGTRQCGPLNVYYYLLQTGTVNSTTGLDGTAMHMNLTFNGTTQDIQWSAIPGVSTLNDIASLVQTSGRNQFGTDFACQYNSLAQAFVLGINQLNSTADYQTAASVIPGYHDATNFKGKVTDGAVTFPSSYYNYNYLRPFAVPSEWQGFTHFSFYQTKNLIRENTSTIGSPNSFAWMGDVPIMAAFDCNLNFQTLTPITGQFAPFQDGMSISLMDKTATTNGMIQEKFYYDNRTQGTIIHVPNVNRQVYAFMGTKTGFIASAATGQVTVTKWWNTYTDAAGYTHNITDATGNVTVGDPIFCSDGRVRYVKSITTLNLFQLDDLTYSTSSAQKPFAYEPKPVGVNWPNAVWDFVDDESISARIGTLGLKTRFFEALPAVTTGCVAPGWVVSALNTKFYANNIGVDQQYIIGTCHPTYQVQQLSGIITAMTLNAVAVSIYTVASTYTTQTNLNLKYTDSANGNTINILPTAVLLDMATGVKSDRSLYQFEKDKHLAINQDSGLRIWNGTQWTDNIIHKKIQNHIRDLADYVVTYDTEYGVIVIGYEEGYIPDHMYTVGIRNDKFLGASQFNSLAFPDPLIQPVGFGLLSSAPWNRILYMSVAPVASRLAGSTLTTFELYRTTDGTSAEIPWSFTTGDDVAPMQRNTLRHLEGNIYISGIPPNDEVPRATVINVTAYNDVGRQVSIKRNIVAHPHYYGSVSYDTRLEGHRIRYKIDLDKATAVINGMDVTYVNYDKAQPVSLRQTTEGTWQREISAPTLWVTSRTPSILNLATGKAVTQTGTVSRGTGPDGRTTSSMGT